MARRKRRRTESEQHHVDGSVLSSLYPTSRLRTLHDLLLALLLPSLPSSPVPSSTTAAAEDTAAARSFLVREGDPADYVSLLRNGYGALSDAAPPIGSTTLEQRWTHQQVIERVVQVQFRQGKNASNVLCFGFQQPRPRSFLETERIAPAGLACVSDNAAVTVLNSQTWRTIHARVGDCIMLYLLSYADVFHPLPHKCFIQVAGTSVLLSARCRDLKLQFMERWGCPREKKSTGIFGRKDASKNKHKTLRVNSKHSIDLGSVGGDAHHMDMRSISNSSIHHEVFRHPKKHHRPYSWQRRKARKVHIEQGEEEGGSNLVKDYKGGILLQGSSGVSILESRIGVENTSVFSSDVEKCSVTQGDVKNIPTSLGTEADTLQGCQSKDSSFSTFEVVGLRKSGSCDEMKGARLNMHPLDHLLQQKFFCCTAPTNAEQDDIAMDKEECMTAGFADSPLFSKLNSGTQHEQVLKVLKGAKSGAPPSRLCHTKCYYGGAGAGRRLINRTRMFYKAKFSHHAGLPKNHVLQRLRPTYNDVAVLFEAIFGQKSLCNSKDFGECCFLCSKKCSKCICCLLKKLIANARHCQYARFLERHCPPCVGSRPTKGSARDMKLKVAVLSHEKGYATQDEECTTECYINSREGVENYSSPLQGDCQNHAHKCSDGFESVLAEERSSDFCTQSQVVAFIWAVFRRIIPKELLGSTGRNWRALRKNIFAFVSLRRHECFSLQQCMFKLRLSGYSWCQEQSLSRCSLSKDIHGSNILENHSFVGRDETENSSENLQQQYSWRMGNCPMMDSSVGCTKEKHSKTQKLGRIMLEKWVYWLFSNLIVPLIQSHFYVTESEKYRQNVLFYRKSVWAKMKSSAVAEMMKFNFKRLSTHSTVSLLKKGSLGFSRARLLPKRTGMRLISNLGSSSALPASCARDTIGRVSTVRNWVSLNCFGQQASATRTGKLSRRRGKLSGSMSKDHAPKVGTTIMVQRGMKWNTIKSGLIFKPINLVLRDLHYCLKFEQESHGGDLGCSVFDYNDVYLKLLPFIVNFKRSSKAGAPLYLAVCDVLQAFDTIKQDKLVDIVQEFVREEEYCVRRYSYASASVKSIKVVHERSATSAKNVTNFMETFLQLAAKQVNAVCIDQAYATKLKRSQIIELLEEHIMRNILQIGQHYYLQVVGIPQGSILSSLLCSLYYGHLERYRLASALHLDHTRYIRKEVGIDMNMEVTGASDLTKADGISFCLKPQPSFRPVRQSSVNSITGGVRCFFSQNSETCGHSMCFHSTQRSLGKAYCAVKTENTKPQNVLLRLVDDWLFISDSQDSALEFVIKMHRGFVDYNCVANKLKTALSFDAEIGGSPLKMKVYRTEDGACYMQWSGLLINCNTLEIQADYTRYCGVDLRSTLTVWRKNNQGCYLMTKLCQFMRPKCHPIFYDTNINSPATVFLNAYQAFLLCAMKFHAYNCSLPCGGKCNPEFGFRAVQKTARYMHSLIVHRTRKIASNSQIKPVFLLHVKEIEWLALSAFRKVLVRKQSRYLRLLYLIETELRSPKYDGLSSTPFVLSALDAKRSSMFKYIIY